MARLRRSDVWHLAAGLSAVGAVTLIYAGWLGVTHAAIVSTSFLLVVLLVAATGRLWIAVVISLASFFCFNYFFLPPVGTWTVSDPLNWLALLALLGVSMVASHLSAVARDQTREALERRDDLVRLLDLSRDVLGMTAGTDGLPALARSVATRFELTFVAVALQRAGCWDVCRAGAEHLTLDEQALSAAFAAAVQSRTAADVTGTGRGAASRVAGFGGRTVQLVALRAEDRPVGFLATGGRSLHAGTLDNVAGLAVLAIERARLLEERKAAEITRHSEELKSALLMSIGHDLRTPLAAIRVAADNILAGDLQSHERVEQAAVIQAEAERLSRLFENILELVRLDAGAVTADARWVHPSEIVEAARAQAARTLQNHELVVDVDHDVPVRFDPRLAAGALAHVLENAAQYSPPGSRIDVGVAAGAQQLCLSVRDRGPGLSAEDLAGLFDRFYRGTAARSRGAGTGLGLAIARGLLAVAGGQIRARNAPGGGAEFVIEVPVRSRALVPALRSTA